MAKGKYKYWLSEDGLLLLEAWARDGLTDEKIAARMGINVATLYRYKNQFSEICNALEKGKEIVDIKVENALLQRALGCTVTETKIKESALGTEKQTITKQYPPDVAAAIIWLKNRKPDKWRDKPQGTQEIEDISESERDVFG